MMLNGTETTSHRLVLSLPQQDWHYLEACARIRQITLTRLFIDVLEKMARDQLVLAVLDDNSQRQRKKGEHRHHTRKPREHVDGSANHSQ